VKRNGGGILALGMAQAQKLPDERANDRYEKIPMIPGREGAPDMQYVLEAALDVDFSFHISLSKPVKAAVSQHVLQNCG